MTTNDRPTILVYGYGNPGRQDDGLGIAFVHELKQLAIPYCTIEENYQLTTEDALLLSQFDSAVFVDASLDSDTYLLSRITPSQEMGFMTHAIHPATVVSLCNELYAAFPHCYLLELRGYEWNMQEGLSDAAHENLRQALNAFIPMMQSDDPGKLLQQRSTDKTPLSGDIP